MCGIRISGNINLKKSIKIVLPSLSIVRNGLNKFFNRFPLQRMLCEKAIHPMLAGRPPIFRKIIARKHRNPDAGEILSYFLGWIKAIHSGQTHIRKDEIRRHPIDFLQGLFTVSCLLNGDRGETFMKTRPKRFPKETIVLHH